MTIVVLQLDTWWFCVCIATFIAHAAYMGMQRRRTNAPAQPASPLPPTPNEHTEPVVHSGSPTSIDTPPPSPTCSPRSAVVIVDPLPCPHTGKGDLPSTAHRAQKLKRQISMPLSAAAKALPSLRVPIPVKRVLTHPDAPYSDSNAEERKAEGECGTADCPVDAQENVVSPSSNLRAANARRGSVNVTPTHRLSRRNTTMRPPTASRPSTFPRKSSTRTGLRKARTQAHVHKPLSALPFLHTRRKSTRHGPVRLARPACPENSLPCEVYVQRYENPFRLRRRRAAKAARRAKEMRRARSTPKTSTKIRPKIAGLRRAMRFATRLPFAHPHKARKLRAQPPLLSSGANASESSSVTCVPPEDMRDGSETCESTLSLCHSGGKSKVKQTAENVTHGAKTLKHTEWNMTLATTGAVAAAAAMRRGLVRRMQRQSPGC